MMSGQPSLFLAATYTLVWILSINIVNALVIDCGLLVHPQCSSCSTKTAASSTKVFCTACNGPAYAVTDDTCGKLLSNSTKAQWHFHQVRNGAGGSASVSFTGGHGLLYAGCSPGYYAPNGSKTCSSCGTGFYCPGGAAGAALRHSCPAPLTTAIDTAPGVDVCSAPAGYIMQGNKVVPCKAGTYRTGMARSNACKDCPSGTTTKQPAAKSAKDCS